MARQPENPLWVDIEKTTSLTKDLTLLLLGDVKSPCDISTLSLPTQTFLRAWRFLLRIKDTDAQDINYRLPLNILEAKIPMLSVIDLVRHGITHVSDLYNGPQPKTPEQIMTQFQLTSDKNLAILLNF